jgi:hypothetical protein
MNEHILSIVLASICAMLQALTLYVVNDLRSRVSRLEDGHMRWNGKDRRSDGT